MCSSLQRGAVRVQGRVQLDAEGRDCPVECPMVLCCLGATPAGIMKCIRVTLLASLHPRACATSRASAAVRRSTRCVAERGCKVLNMGQMLTEFCAQGAGSFEGVDELLHAPFSTSRYIILLFDTLKLIPPSFPIVLYILLVYESREPS